MKKMLAGLIAVCIFALNVMPAFAVSKIAVKDVSTNYWAKKEIYQVINDKIMSTDANGCFNPENSMTRIEFVHALLKILSNDNLNIEITNSFTDVQSTYPGYADILRSEQLGLVYGYPDKTFRAEKALLRSESTSIISHITKDKYANVDILKQFSDSESIPAWAIQSYAKTTNYGIYINYPNSKMLNPNKDLTRAEGAVLLAKLQAKLNLVKDEYKQEHVLRTEHLNVTKKAPCNEVTITNLRKIILKNNVLSILYDEKFLSKKAHAGDIVNFIINQNVYTEEGTLVIPANTKLIAEVTCIQPAKWFNKNARVKLAFRKMVMPDCKTYGFEASPFTKDGMLKEGPWMTAGKLVAYTLGFGVAGAGAGVGFAFIPNPAKIGTGLAIGIPIGCTVGLITGLVTPGLNYKAKKCEKLLIILDDDTSIWNK